MSSSSGVRHHAAAPFATFVPALLLDAHDALFLAAIVLLATLTLRLRRALAEERRTTAELERANQALERFTALVSHDLREPLSAIAISSERLTVRLRERLDDEEDELLGYVTAGTQEMRGLIDGFLSAAREREPRRARNLVSTHTLAEQALAALRPRVLARDAKVVLAPLPAVEGDPAALRSLFQNLFSNALKFVPPERTPEIYVHAERRRGAWRFTVQDNGVGIDPDEIDDVFAMLARGSGAARFPGTGLGLASCRAVVERHGGRIWMEPSQGGGTRVAFTLPAAAGPRETPAWPGERAAPGTGRRPLEPAR